MFTEPKRRGLSVSAAPPQKNAAVTAQTAVAAVCRNEKYPGQLGPDFFMQKPPRQNIH